MYQNKALAKVTGTSWGVSSATWLVAVDVLGLWGVLIAAPISIGSTIWYAKRTKDIMQ